MNILYKRCKKCREKKSYFHFRQYRVEIRGFSPPSAHCNECLLKALIESKKLKSVSYRLSLRYGYTFSKGGVFSEYEPHVKKREDAIARYEALPCVPLIRSSYEAAKDRQLKDEARKAKPEARRAEFWRKYHEKRALEELLK